MRTLALVLIFMVLSVALVAAEPVSGKLYYRLPAGSQPAWDILTIKDFDKDVRGNGSWLFVTHYIDGRDTPITEIYPSHAAQVVFFVPDQARGDAAVLSRAKQLGVPIR